MVDVIAIVLILSAAFPVRLRQEINIFGSFSAFDIVLILISFIMLLTTLKTGKLHLGDKKIFKFLLFPLVVSVISLMWSQDYHLTFRLIVSSVESILSYVIAVNLFFYMKPQKVINYLGIYVFLLIAGAILSFFHIVGFAPSMYGMLETDQKYLNYIVSYYSRFSHPFIGLSNDFASVLALFIFIFIMWGILERRKLYLFLSVLTFCAILLTLSRGVIVAVIISGSIFIWLNRKFLGKLLPIVFLSITLVALIGYGYYKFNEYTQTYLIDRLSPTNIDIRWTTLKIARDTIDKSPILGYGGGVVGDITIESIGGVHNAYIQQILYFGIFLGFMVSFVLWLIVCRFFYWRTLNNKIKMMATSIGISLLGQLIIFMTETSYESVYPRLIFNFTIGFCVILLKGIEREELSSSLINSKCS